METGSEPGLGEVAVGLSLGPAGAEEVARGARRPGDGRRDEAQERIELFRAGEAGVEGEFMALRGGDAQAAASARRARRRPALPSRGPTGRNGRSAAAGGEMAEIDSARADHRDDDQRQRPVPVLARPEMRVGYRGGWRWRGEAWGRSCLQGEAVLKITFRRPQPPLLP